MHSWIPHYSWSLWKWWLAMLTGRRNFLPILSVIFLTFPDTNIQQVGLYMAMGELVAIAFQIPVGILADKIGVQRILLFGKIALVCSTVLFIVGDSFLWFLIGAIGMTFGSSVCTDGNISVWVRHYLTQEGRESDYRHLTSAARGEVSLFSAFLMAGLPLLFVFGIKAPLIAFLAVDLFGLFVVCVMPNIKHKNETKKNISSFSFSKLKTLIKTHSSNGFFLILLFTATIEAVIGADAAFRAPYLVSLGYSLPFIGFVAALSRIIWFLVGKSVPFLEKHFTFRQFLWFDAIFFPLLYGGIIFLENPYLIGFLFSLSIGYMWGRGEIYMDELFLRIQNKEDSATLLSFKSQYSNMLKFVLQIILGSVMLVSYPLGFLFLAIFLLMVLGITGMFIMKNNV